MLRMETETGWWLITHPAHARLAGAFAAAWGNAQFRKPEPRTRVLHGISAHDDGWAARDEHPKITREGKPSAFSTELVGKYSAFEEIDLGEYLAVREKAVKLVAEWDAYAGLLIAMHTYNLLSEHADRSTIAPEQLPLLDTFLVDLKMYQEMMLEVIAQDDQLTDAEKSEEMLQEHFRLLQACDNLSLLTCVSFPKAADLLHALPLKDGGTSRVRVLPLEQGRFQLTPWPFEERELTFAYPARHVDGHRFVSSEELETAYRAAKEQTLVVRLTE